MKALIALECVVRHSNISQATEELCVTHSAISKQLSQLEVWLGQPLFEANCKPMRPTPAGAALASAACQAWQIIGSAVDDFAIRPEKVPLRVIAPSTFAMRWLIPRLWTFSMDRPNIAVQVTPTHTGQAWHTLTYDVAIRRGEGLPASPPPTPLLRETLGLAMSPRLSEQFAPDERRLPGSIALLTAETRPGELEAWMAAADLRGVARAPRRRFPHFYIALEAALAGAGAIVAPLLTIEDLIRKGDLVEPWPAIHVAGPTYVAFSDQRSHQQRSAKTFIDWLAREAGNSCASLLSGR